MARRTCIRGCHINALNSTSACNAPYVTAMIVPASQKAAVMMISTSSSPRASFDSPVARAGAAPVGTQFMAWLFTPVLRIDQRNFD